MKVLVFFKAAVIWVLFGGLFCFVLQFHSILDQSFSLSSLLWNVVNTNLKEGVGRYVNLYVGFYMLLHLCKTFIYILYNLYIY